MFNAPSNQCTTDSCFTSIIRIILSLACTISLRSFLFRNIWLMSVFVNSGNLMVFKCFQVLSPLFQRNISPIESDEYKILALELKHNDVTYPMWPPNS